MTESPDPELVASARWFLLYANSGMFPHVPNPELLKRRFQVDTATAHSILVAIAKERADEASRR
jgi:hypothetical protein